MIYLAADHRGFELKENLKKYLLEQKNYPVEDAGALQFDQSDDYADFAGTAAEKIAKNPAEHKGIFLCGSGHGMDMAANKFKGIRAALCFNTAVAMQSREHEDANVLVLAADWVSPDLAQEIAAVWLEAKFTGEERNVRRLGKMKKIEEKNFR